MKVKKMVFEGVEVGFDDELLDEYGRSVHRRMYREFYLPREKEINRDRDTTQVVKVKPVRLRITAEIVDAN